ncbi:MAG: cytochrome c-type biogenesis protein CcmH [Dehalococcoidia bacterium]|nr:cytochrome c-type biogenesis protein CcmH [Dehalococcoidia bacterium]
MKYRAAFFLAAFLFLVAGVTALAKGPIDQEATKIGQELKCPVCQNISVADSQSELATQMRATIREKLAAGESKESIIRYFVDRYGEEVLLNPPKDGFTTLVWLVPPALILLLGAVLVRGIRNNKYLSPIEDPYEEEADDLSEDDIRKYDEVLNRELSAN